MNDFGVIISRSGGHAVLWGEVAEPVSAIVISDATVKRNNNKTLSVTVQISNPNATTAYDVTVTTASLGGVDSNSALPRVYGAIKPGASKKCLLQFKSVLPGDVTLYIEGTCSLGSFFTTQTVTVP